jgi:hypothetical protein
VELIIVAVIVYFAIRGLKRAGTPVAGTPLVGWVPGTKWRVLVPLGRTDVRLVLRHPAFVVGVLVTPLMLFAATESVTSWRYASAGIALGLVPLGWLTIIAVDLVMLRPRRTGTDELFATLPTPQPVRTSAMLSAAIGPVIVSIVLAVAWVLVVSSRDAVRGSPRWAEIAAGVLIVAGSVCVGVAVARWLPNPGFGVLAAAATMVIQARFLDVTTWPWDRTEGDQLRFLGFLASPTGVVDDFLEVRPAGWHLAYLGGLVVVMAGVALAREGMRRPVAIVIGAGVLVAATAGWSQIRPLSAAQQDAMVSYLVEPAGHQICDTSAAVRFCSYPNFAGQLVGWQDRVHKTLAMLPAVALTDRPPLEVVQRPAIVVSSDACTPIAFEEGLPPGVAARVSAAALWPADGHVHPPFDEESFPCSERATGGFFLAVQTGAWGVGLPPAPHDRNDRCTANGQARAVVALWAGTAGTPGGATTLRDVISDGSTDGLMIDFDDWDDPPMWGVDYTVADADLALAMLDLPVDDVRAALAADWLRWTDAGTPSSALATELGLAATGATPTAPSAPTCT